MVRRIDGPRRIANAFGVAGLCVLLAGAVLVLTTLHFLGLAVLGAFALAVSWVIERGGPPPETPIALAERVRLRHFVRFYRHCAVVLILIGIAGFLAWTMPGLAHRGGWPR